MQGDAQPVLSLELQAVETRRVHARLGVSRHDLARRDVGGRIHGEMEGDGQFIEVHLVFFDDDFAPGGVLDHLHGQVILAAVLIRRRQIARFHVETRRQEIPVARDVGDDRTFETLHALEDDDGVSARALELEHRGRDVLPPDGFCDAHQFFGVVSLHHLQEAAQALIDHIARPIWPRSRDPYRDSRGAAGGERHRGAAPRPRIRPR